MNNIAELIDEAAEVNMERVALQKQVDKLAEKEKDLLATIHAEMIKAGVRNSLATVGWGVKIAPQQKVVATDWDQFREYIRKTNNFSLLHARITESAVKELQAEGVDVPGVDIVELDVVKLYKV